VFRLTWLQVAGVAGLLISLGFVSPARTEAPKKAAAEDKEEKLLTVEDVMETVHGEDGLRTKVMVAVRQKKLEDAKKPMEQWVKLAGQLGQNKPPRGTEASWKKLTAAYEKQVQNIAAAVKADKPEAIRESIRVLAATTCNGCHSVHKKH